MGHYKKVSRFSAYWGLPRLSYIQGQGPLSASGVFVEPDLFPLLWITTEQHDDNIFLGPRVSFGARMSTTQCFSIPCTQCN